MGWMRIGLFIVLTLVASTLPATAAPTTAPDQPRAQSQTDKPAAEGTGLSIHAAPHADVWTSPPSRPPASDTHLYAVATLTAAPLHIRPWSIAGAAGRFNAKSIHEQTRAGLICRYPNAPPNCM